MAAKGPKIGFFTDENVPDSIGNYLRNRGHSVVRTRSVMKMGSPDQIVAEAALRAGRVLMSWDKDFNDQRFRQPRFEHLMRVGLQLP